MQSEIDPRDFIVAAAEETALLLSHASYRESCYQKTLAHLLEKEFIVRQEVHIIFKLPDGFPFGTGRADIVCQHRKTGQIVVCELKANVSSHLKRDLGQISRYMFHYECHSGLLLYFTGWERKVEAHMFDH